MLSMVFLMHCNQITCQLKGNNPSSWDLKNFEVFTCQPPSLVPLHAYFFCELRDRSLPPWCHSSRGVLNVPSSSVLKRAFAALTETAAQDLSKSPDSCCPLTTLSDSCASVAAIFDRIPVKVGFDGQLLLQMRAYSWFRVPSQLIYP